MNATPSIKQLRSGVAKNNVGSLCIDKPVQDTSILLNDAAA
jgi:hypothetical protein